MPLTSDDFMWRRCELNASVSLRYSSLSRLNTTTNCSYWNWLVDGGSRWFCDDIAWLRNWFFSKRNISVRIAAAFSTPRTGRQAPIFLTTISCGRLALQCHVQCKASLALELCPPACTADGIRPLWPTIHAVEKTFSRCSFYPRPLSIGLLSISD